MQKCCYYATLLFLLNYLIIMPRYFKTLISFDSSVMRLYQLSPVSSIKRVLKCDADQFTVKLSLKIDLYRISVRCILVCIHGISDGNCNVIDYFRIWQFLKSFLRYPCDIAWILPYITKMNKTFMGYLCCVWTSTCLVVNHIKYFHFHYQTRQQQNIPLMKFLYCY